jgi:hypothetical protein
MGEFSLCSTLPHTIYFLKKKAPENLEDTYILFTSGQALTSELRKTMNNLGENFQVSKNFDCEAEIPKTKTYFLLKDYRKPFNLKKYL